MDHLDEKNDSKGVWMWVDTVTRFDPRLYEWVGYDLCDLNTDVFVSKAPD